MRLLGSTLTLAVVALASAAAAFAAPTPGSYRAQANAVCLKRGDQLSATDQPTGSAEAHPAKTYAEEYAIDVRAYEQLYKLDPPPSLLAPHRLALQALWRALVQFRKIILLPGGGAAKTPATRAAWMKYVMLYSQVSAAWKALGVEACEA